MGAPFERTHARRRSPGGAVGGALPGNRFDTQRLGTDVAASAPDIEVITCVDTSANEVIDELLCLEFRGNGGADWPCPVDAGSASGAFVDGLDIGLF